MSQQEYKQDSFFSEEVLRSLEIEKPQIQIITFDSTPAYDWLLLDEQFHQTFENLNVIYFNPPKYSSPLDLIIKSRDPYFLIEKVMESGQRHISAIFGTSPYKKGVNFVTDSLVSSIAWTLYSKESIKNFNKGEYKTFLGIQKSLIEKAAEKLNNRNSSHIVRRLSFNSLTPNELNHLNEREVRLMEGRIEIFNGCLITASNIWSGLTGRDVSLIENPP